MSTTPETLPARTIAASDARLHCRTSVVLPPPRFNAFCARCGRRRRVCELKPCEKRRARRQGAQMAHRYRHRCLSLGGGNVRIA